ncbi:MAG: hypothetical protein OXN20_11170, partial [Gemmatimonadota bacterium]|nr:hypothetical protein [Gemmatimonadota bacterium]
MADYQPLDLSALCSAGLEVLGANANAPIGKQLFRGLPFLVNDDGSNCFIALDEASGRVTIPINASARRVIIAHRLLDSDLMEGGPLGETVADYLFRMAEGEEFRIPVRERFEIAHLSSGGAPFVAFSDQNDQLMPRYEGRWESMGRRQTEVSRGSARGYF